MQEVDENGIPRKKSSSGLSAAEKKKKKKKKKRSFPLTALSCGICGQTFKFETHYEPHVKAHEEKLNLDVEVACPLCNETLASKRHLNPHFKKNHPNDGGCCVECLQVNASFIFLLSILLNKEKVYRVSNYFKCKIYYDNN